MSYMLDVGGWMRSAAERQIALAARRLPHHGLCGPQYMSFKMSLKMRFEPAAWLFGS